MVFVEKAHSLTCLDHSSVLRPRQAAIAQLNLHTGAMIEGPAVLPNAFRQACCNESMPTIIESMASKQKLLATLGKIPRGSMLPISQYASCLKGPLQQPMRRLQALEPALWSPDRSAFVLRLALCCWKPHIQVGLLTIFSADGASVLARAESGRLVNGPLYSESASIALQRMMTPQWSGPQHHSILLLWGKRGSIPRLQVTDCSKQQQQQQDSCLTVPIKSCYFTASTGSWSPSGQSVAAAWCYHYNGSRVCNGGAVFKPLSAAWLFQEEKFGDQQSSDQAQLSALKTPVFWAACPPPPGP